MSTPTERERYQKLVQERIQEWEQEMIPGYEIISESLSGSRGEDQKRIAEEGCKWLNLLLQKNQDYGSSVWKVPVLAPDTDTSSAIRVRMSDKVERLSNLIGNGTLGEVADESLEDTISDLGSYCLLWLVRPKGQEDGGT